MVQRIDHLALPDKIRKMPILQTGPTKREREQKFDHKAPPDKWESHAMAPQRQLKYVKVDCLQQYANNGGSLLVVGQPKLEWLLPLPDECQ